MQFVVELYGLSPNKEFQESVGLFLRQRESQNTHHVSVTALQERKLQGYHSIRYMGWIELYLISFGLMGSDWAA